jgi:2-enoate reductase
LENKYKSLFTPTRIGNVELKNRFALAPMGPLGLGDADGGFNQRGIDFYTRRAQGGTGLIITGVTFVDDEVEEHDMPNTPSSTHNPVHFVRTAREMTERVHAYNSKVFIQLSGGFGRVTIPTNLGEHPPVAPSPIMHRWFDRVCRELTQEEIRKIVTKFGEGAYHAKRAGFDGVQIHAVHEGYLIDQFAIALFNLRTDAYGGSLENRLRFAREIVMEIKRTCGEDFVVTLRYSPKSFIKELRDGALPGEEFIEKGRDMEEGLLAAKLLTSYGYDALDVDVGCYDAWWWSHPPMYQEKGLYRPYAKAVKGVIDAPVLCAGRMDDPDMAAAAIEDGTCDIISLGRPLLADPDFVQKLRRNEIASIRPCLSCQEGCMGRISEYSAINCAVNPQTCRERAAAYNPVHTPKDVLIVGGGPAGCEAARVLATRGHRPHLYEKSDRLGGNLIPGGIPDFKEDDRALVKWYAHELDRLGVPVHLNAGLDAAKIKSIPHDALIIATGGTPKTFSLGDTPLLTAADVLTAKSDPGEKTVIIGGGLVGCELALWLAQKGKDVTIVEALDSILAVNRPLCHANSDMLERLIPHHGVQVYTNAKAKAYRDGNLTVASPNGDRQIACDSVILAVGYASTDSLYRELEFDEPDSWLLGDARRVSNIMYAVWDAFEVSNSL